MMADVIVVLSTLLSLAFVVAWLAFPRLRAWIERPKYHFQEHLERYDLERSREADLRGDRSA
jgi:hypothetical protein